MQSATFQLQSALSKAFVDFARRNQMEVHEIEDYSVETWQQWWSSTACGFGGMGGASMTPAHTIVLRRGSEHHVYVSGMFAYSVARPTDKFREDLKERRLLGKTDFDKAPETYDEQRAT